MNIKGSGAFAPEPFKMSWKRDLNPRPTDYESVALPTALFQHIQFADPPFGVSTCYNLTYYTAKCKDNFDIEAEK